MRYEFECKCSNRQDAVRTVRRRNDPVACTQCGEIMKRVFSPPQIVSNESGGIPGMCHSLPGESIYVRSKKHFRALVSERCTATSHAVNL